MKPKKSCVEQVVRYITRCSLGDLKEINLSRIFQRFNISEVCLRENFKRYYGITPGRFIVREKMYRAALWLVRDTRLKISELSEQMGFCSSDYFIRIFKAHFGLTPAQYRETRLAS